MSPPAGDAAPRRTRPMFEVGADRARESAAATALAAAWACEMFPAPPLAGFDYLAIRDGRVHAVLEIKSRLNRAPADFGGTLFLNVDKRDGLLEGAAQLGAPLAIFAWHFPGEIRWVDVAGLAGRELEERGRADRDGKDIRMVLRVGLEETGRVGLDAAPVKIKGAPGGGGSLSGPPPHIIGSEGGTGPPD